MNWEFRDWLRRVPSTRRGRNRFRCRRYPSNRREFFSIVDARKWASTRYRFPQRYFLNLIKGGRRATIADSANGSAVIEEPNPALWRLSFRLRRLPDAARFGPVRKCGAAAARQTARDAGWRSRPECVQVNWLGCDAVTLTRSRNLFAFLRPYGVARSKLPRRRTKSVTFPSPLKL